MRASRLLATLILLQLRGRMTANTLSDELGVSVRTVYRDIDELSAAGIPVYSDRGSQGGFRLHDSYRTNLTGLTNEEAMALLVVGIPSAAADLGLSSSAAMARVKLLAAISQDASNAAMRVTDRFHLDLLDWYKRSQAPEQLTTVASAIWENRRLCYRYKSWKGWSETVTDPLGLVLKGGAWYLVARVACADSVIRTYKVVRLANVKATGEQFDYPTDFSLANYWIKQVDRFERDMRRGTATLRASPSSLANLELLGAAIAAPLLNAEPDETGWREAEVPIESVSHAAHLILGFANEVEVVRPDALRVELSQRATAVVQLYGPATAT